MEAKAVVMTLPAARPDRPGAIQNPGLMPLLRRLGRVRVMARGDRLMPDTRTNHDLYLIESGAIKLSLVSPQGDELVVGLFFEGDVLGLQHLGGVPDADIATALERTHVRVLPLAMLHELSRHNPALQHQLFRLASQRIAQLQQHMLVVARQSATRRVAGFLIELAGRRGEPDGSMRLPLSLYGIGCYLGLSLETVCRSLRQIANEGAIRKQGRLVQVLDYPALQALAGEDGDHLPHHPYPENGAGHPVCEAC